MAIKPCAKCHHPKTRHRRHECRETWQVTGATFMGVRVVTKWCPCDGYRDQAGRTADGGEAHV